MDEHLVVVDRWVGEFEVMEPLGIEQMGMCDQTLDSLCEILDQILVDKAGFSPLLGPCR